VTAPEIVGSERPPRSISVSTRTHTASLTADLSETRLRLARLAATARANFLPLI